MRLNDQRALAESGEHIQEVGDRVFSRVPRHLKAIYPMVRGLVDLPGDGTMKLLPDAAERVRKRRISLDRAMELVGLYNQGISCIPKA